MELFVISLDSFILNVSSLSKLFDSTDNSSIPKYWHAKSVSIGGNKNWISETIYTLSILIIAVAVPLGMSLINGP